MVEMLAASGDMVGDPRPIQHPVKFYERGSRPLEIVTSRQWFIRNGGRDDGCGAQLLERGTQLDWHPPYMQVRFDDWVNGLNGDWLSAGNASSACPSPSGTPSVPTARPTTTAADRPRRVEAAGRPHHRRARGLHGGAARRARRLHGRSRRHGHLGHLLGHAADRLRLGGRPCAVRAPPSPWTCGRRVPRSSAPGSSPPCCARTRSTTCCRGGTPPSTAGSSTRTARRCPSRRAT